MEDFALNHTNIYIEKIYCHNNNYKIVHNECHTNRCMIFFSGNGLYYPNTVDTFQRVIVENDRYEWEHIMTSSLILQQYEMIILVRDVYKTYYVEGINGKLNTVDKVLEFLKDIVKGFDVYTCGNSAGGYMATIAGKYLCAKCIYNFGGQWDLSHETVKDAGVYTNIAHLADKNIIWFYAANADLDNCQKKNLKENIGKISLIAIDSYYHGDYLLPECYAKCLTLSAEELCKIAAEFKEKIVSKRRIARKFLKGKELYRACFHDVVRCHKSLQFLTGIFKY